MAFGCTTSEPAGETRNCSSSPDGAATGPLPAAVRPLRGEARRDGARPARLRPQRPPTGRLRIATSPTTSPVLCGGGSSGRGRRPQPRRDGRGRAGRSAPVVTACARPCRSGPDPPGAPRRSNSSMSPRSSSRPRWRRSTAPVCRGYGRLRPGIGARIADMMSAIPLPIATAVIQQLTAWDGTGAMARCDAPTLLLRTELDAQRPSAAGDQAGPEDWSHRRRRPLPPAGGARSGQCHDRPLPRADRIIESRPDYQFGMTREAYQ